MENHLNHKMFNISICFFFINSIRLSSVSLVRINIFILLLLFKTVIVFAFTCVHPYVHENCWWMPFGPNIPIAHCPKGIHFHTLADSWNINVYYMLDLWFQWNLIFFLSFRYSCKTIGQWKRYTYTYNVLYIWGGRCKDRPNRTECRSSNR